MSMHATFARNKFYYQDKDAIGTGAVYGIEFNNIRVVVDVSVKGSVLGLGEVRFDADRIILEGETRDAVDNISLAFLMENLDTEAAEAVLQTMSQAPQEGSEGKEQAARQQEEQATRQILQRKPMFAIEGAHARWQEGEAAGSFRIAYVGNPKSSPSVVGGLVDGWSGDLKMVLPRALVVRHMSMQTRKEISDELEGGEENEVDIEKEVKDKVDKWMGAMIGNGVFEGKGDTLNVDAHLRDGKLTLNGKERPPEILLELLPPFFLR
jgi:uncharacterized protein YdgA (DUF945 family)